MLTIALAFAVLTQDVEKPRPQGVEVAEAEETARVEAAKMQVLELQKVVNTFYVVNARMPKSWDDLLLPDATGRRFLDGDGPPNDPWGRRYRLLRGERANEMSVLSVGPDGRPDTPDDADSRGPATPARLLARLNDLDGKRLDLQGLDRRVVVLHFWSARCGYEKHAVSELARIAADHPDDVAVIAIASQAEEIGARPSPKAFAAKDIKARPYSLLREQAERQGIARVLVDHDGPAARFFGARMTTHCVVLDRQHQVVYAGALDDDPQEKRGREAHRHVADAVAAALAGGSIGWPWPEAHGTPLHADDPDASK